MFKFSKKMTVKILSNIVILLMGNVIVEAANHYQVVDLGALGIGRSESFAISSNNTVVGNSVTEDLVNHAFVNIDDEIYDLGYLLGDVDTDGKSFAFGTNDNYAVGYSDEVTIDPDDIELTNTIEMAVYYDIQNFTVNKIPALDVNNLLNARATSINNNNLVVGFGLYNPPNDEDDNGEPVDFIYSRGFFFNIDTNSSVTVVSPLVDDATQHLVLRDVNDNGLATGILAENLSILSRSKIIIVDVANPENVETFDNIFGGLVQQPWSINNSGKVVGRGLTTDDNKNQAFLLDSTTKEVIALGYLNDSFKYSEAFGINNFDQVVGISQFQNAPTIYHAFLYENGEMKDLDALIGCDTGWRIHEATSINDDGVIAGTGIFDGQRRAFKLLPIENSTAPNCDENDGSDSSSNSGSGPLSPLMFLSFIVMFFLRRKAIR